jgi:hypothetical protein
MNGVVFMATKSILKNIVVKDRKNLRSLVNALEKAESHATDLPPLTKPCRDVKGEEIKKLFANLRGE